MPRKSRPEWDGQQLLPGMAHARSRRVRRNGKTQNAETVVTNECLDCLAKRPGIVAFAWRNNSGMAFLRYGGAITLAPEGSPDIIGQLVDGRFLGVECKLPGEEPTELQVDFLERIRRYGGVALVVHSAEELAADLRRIVCGEGSQ